MKNGFIKGLIYLVLALIFGAAAVFMPYFSPVFGAFSLGFLMASCVIAGKYAVIPFGIIIGALSYFLFGSITFTAYFISFSVPAALVFSFAFDKKQDLKNTFAFSSLGSGVFVLLSSLLGLYSSGGISSATYSSLISGFCSDISESFYEAMKVLPVESAEKFEESFKTLMESFESLISEALPSIFGILVVAITFSAVLIAKRFIFRSGKDVSFMGRLKDYRLSRASVYVSFAAVLLSLFISGPLAIACDNFYNFMSALFITAFAAAVSRFFEASSLTKTAKTVITIVIFAAAFVLPFTILIMVMIGIFSTMVRTRIKKTK